jgi:hypothetical protein
MGAARGGMPGASHMLAAFPKSHFDRCELLSLLGQRLHPSGLHEPPYGTVRTVVWEDAGGDSASYPILFLKQWMT